MIRRYSVPTGRALDHCSEEWNGHGECILADTDFISPK